jgi:hypothetical protein
MHFQKISFFDPAPKIILDLRQALIGFDFSKSPNLFIKAVIFCALLEDAVLVIFRLQDMSLIAKAVYFKLGYHSLHRKGEDSRSFQFNFTLRNMMASSGQTSWQQKHLMHFA